MKYVLCFLAGVFSAVVGAQEIVTRQLARVQVVHCAADYVVPEYIFLVEGQEIPTWEGEPVTVGCAVRDTYVESSNHEGEITTWTTEGTYYIEKLAITVKVHFDTITYRYGDYSETIDATENGALYVMKSLSQVDRLGDPVINEYTLLRRTPETCWLEDLEITYACRDPATIVSWQLAENIMVIADFR